MEFMTDRRAELLHDGYTILAGFCGPDVFVFLPGAAWKAVGIDFLG